MSEQLQESTLEEAATLSADAANTVIDWMKHQPKTWQQMTYAEQQELINGATRLAGDLVRDMVRITARDGRTTVAAKVKSVAYDEKGEVKAVLTAADHTENAHELSHLAGKHVLIVIADANGFIGGDIVEPDAPADNQPGMFEGDDTPVMDNTRIGQEAAE